MQPRHQINMVRRQEKHGLRAIPDQIRYISVVIDEGAMYNHEDLLGQIWTNPFDPG